MPAPLLIALPCGPIVSGVVTWATRLANALALRGREVGLILHRPDEGHQKLDLDLHFAVRLHDLSHLPSLEEARGDLSPFIPAYRDAIHDLALASGGPVALSPNLRGDCYGIAAAISMAEPEVMRVLAWCHSSFPYDQAMLAHYEPLIAKFVGVSTHVASMLRVKLPARAGDVQLIHHGVESHRDRDGTPEFVGTPARPLRIIYTGRLEHPIKRIGALVHMSDALNALGIAHELAIVGDGPAASDVRTAASTRTAIRPLGALTPSRVTDLLDQGDILVLASRMEGLSVSIMEALAAGCVPVVTRTQSGANELIADGETGRLVDWFPPPGEDELSDAAVGLRLAEAIQGVLRTGLQRMSRAAMASARERFSLDEHATRIAKLMDAAVAEPPRAWPATRACAFGASNASAGTASGTVPNDAGKRLRDTLRRLRGRKILLHGTGRHTLELAGVIAEVTDIVAFADDDPQRHGQRLWGLPIVPPNDAERMGITDVVISSFINQDEIWQRRSVYESRGLRVHRLYDAA